MTTEPKYVWRNALMLCAAAAVAALVSSCRAPASETGRYQWNIVPREDRADSICVIDTNTGEVAEWGGSSSGWWLKDGRPLALPDFQALRRERAEKEKQAKEAREKRKALVESYARMPLEKQVVWAKRITVCKAIIDKRVAGEHPFVRLESFELLKDEHGPAADKERRPYKVTDDGLVVWFNGMVDGGSLEFGLSPSGDGKPLFPAPATIIDDVKAILKKSE